MPFITPPPADALGSVRYCWHNHPARGAKGGGDALLLELGRNDNRALFLLLDVTGHGDDAAPALAFVRDYLLADPHVWHRSPADLLFTLHGMLQPFFLETGRFVAALALCVDGDAAALTAAHAGVPLPVFAGAGCASVWQVEISSLLGIPADNDYEESYCILDDGRQLLVFTDGVTEAGAPGPQFGSGPLGELLAGLPAGLHAGEVIERLFAALREYDGDTWPRDDVTAICLARAEN